MDDQFERQMEKLAQVAIDLFKTLSKETRGENVILSPVSIYLIISMTAAGARESTLEAIREFLKLPPGNFMHKFASQLSNSIFATSEPDDATPIAVLANNIWVDKRWELRPSFKQLVKEKYSGDAEVTDIWNQVEETRKRVNDWVESHTRGKIRDILPQGSLEPSTAVILANALYFKGSWLEQFQEELTKPDKFYLLDGSFVTVPMMAVAAREERHIGRVGPYKVLHLKYSPDWTRNRWFSMYIVLPDATDGLMQLEQELNPSLLQQLLANQESRTVGKFLLPRFKITSSCALKDSLLALGLELPFQGTANFQDMVYQPPDAPTLKLQEVYHKCFVDVHEKGTEAAAASAAMAIPMCFRPPPPVEDFVADHPFMFFLVEKSTGALLFVGKVANPSQK